MSGDACHAQPADGSCPGATDISGCSCNVGYVGDGTTTCTGIQDLIPKIVDKNGHQPCTTAVCGLILS